MTGGERRDSRSLALGALVCAAVAVLYAPVRSYPFVVYDDIGWILENPLVTGGLSWDGLVGAFTTSVLGNWVPLTWLSHQLDVSLFGLDAGAHHLSNVAIHAAASVTLFAALRRACGETLPAAFTALVFAIHPLHVESVAWVSERRDVLSGFFFALCLLGWARYARDGGTGAYLGALAAFAAGTLAKPMLVTVPVLLLFLDLWPFARQARGARRLLIEKLPFLAVAGGVALATLATQSGGGAVASLEMLPASQRVANAVSSLAAYLATAVWPARLAVFYPYPDAIEPIGTAAAALLALGITALAIHERRRRPWLLVGWGWFLLTLLPVIGLIQVGSQARADRYMYLPLVGPVWAVAMTGARLAARDASTRLVVLATAGFWLLACAGFTQQQVTTWRSSVALFEHARAISGDSPIILVNLAEAWDRAGDAERAIPLYEQSLAGFPHAPRARTRLGALLIDRGRLPEALAQLQEALQRHPEEPDTRHQLGRLLLRDRQFDVAAELLRDEIDRFSLTPEVGFRLAEALAHLGEREEALATLEQVYEAAPDFAGELVHESHGSAEVLAEAHAARGELEAARHWLRRGLLLARLAGDDAARQRLERRRAALDTAQRR